MPGESVEDRLPARTLLVDRMASVRVKRLAHDHAARVADELDNEAAIPKGTLNQFVGHYLRVNAREVETETAVLCLHARGERAAISQIYRCGRGVPVIGCSVPLFNVVRRRPSAPDLLDGRSDRGLNCDLHV